MSEQAGRSAVAKKVAISVAFAPLVLPLLSDTAAADNDLGHRMPDGTPAKLYRNNLTSRFSNAAEWVRQNAWNPTDMTTQYATSVSGTYVNIVDNDYGDSGWYGLWDCAVWGAGSVCSRGDVIINLNTTHVPGGSYSDTEARSLMCEEMGHAAGLAHDFTRNGCMSQEWSATLWTQHDIDLINCWY